MSKIKILVAGETGSGKTTIGWAIANLLKEHSFDIKFNPMEFKDTKHLEDSLGKILPLSDRLDIISEKTSVEIEEVQVHRDYNSEE